MYLCSRFKELRWELKWFPFLFEQMKEILTEKVNQFFSQQDYAAGFLLEIEETPMHKFNVIIDSDTGVTLDLCTVVSRYLEAYLDAEMPEGKYTLEVTSPGISRPLTVARQYVKNIGRPVRVKTIDGQKMDGILVSADDTGCCLEVEEEVRDERNKKHKEKKKIDLSYKEISETKVQVVFT